MPNTSQELILCSTSRLAQHLRALPGSGEGLVWQTVQAMTAGQWLTQLAEEAQLDGLLPDALLLSGESEQIVWETTLAQVLSGEFAALFDRQGLASALCEADALCVVWALEPTAAAASSETKLFLRAREAFLKRCREQGWIDLPRLQQAVIDCLAGGHLSLPAQVRFLGFDRITPLEARLQNVLRQRGVQVIAAAPLPATLPQLQQIECDDLLAECRSVAAWVAEQRALNPAVRLGIVAPDLATLRSPLGGALDAVLHPQLVRPAGAEAARCYNFSLGESLAALPLVRCALDWLALAVRPAKVEQASLSQLLLSPYWSVQEEADARALADAAVRRRLGYFTSLDALRQLLQREGWDAEAASNRCQITTGCLGRLSQAVAGESGRQFPSRWSRHFADWLKLLRWPGNRPLSSHEYQAQQAFLEALGSLAQLDVVLGPVGGSEAVRRLVRMCGERVFQPKTTAPAAVQVLGVLESAGIEFDALWVMGMNDHVWPPLPRPNPFLPATMQQAKATPHASAEVERAFADQVHLRWLSSAPVINFSYSRLAGERLLRPSPLLAGMAAGQPPIVIAPLAPEGRLVRLADALAPAVGAGERVSGGSGLLKAQAICPAWGFYAYRLGAKALEVPVEGLDARERGSLVHAALEQFWRQVRSSQELAQLGLAALDAAIAAAVEAGLAQFEEERHVALPARFRALEGVRLQGLLQRWLQLEAARLEDFTVIATEQKAELDLQGIQIRVVVDRIDQLDDGGCLVIDYKTGRAVDTKNWSRPRLTEPQLPLYACKVVGQVSEAGEALGESAGVAFAKVHADEVRFYGVTAASEVLPAVAGLADKKQKIFDGDRFPDWAAVLGHWSAAIDTVAGEIRTGVAGVWFENEDDLNYCEVKPLLRLPERARQAAEAGVEIAGEIAGEAP